MDILKSGAIFKLSAESIKSPASLRKNNKNLQNNDKCITKDASNATLLRAEFDMVARATPVPSWLSLDSGILNNKPNQSVSNAAGTGTGTGIASSLASVKANRLNSLISNQFDTIARRTPMPPQLGGYRSDSGLGAGPGHGIANPIPRGGISGYEPYDKNGVMPPPNQNHNYPQHMPSPMPIHHFQSSHGMNPSLYQPPHLSGHHPPTTSNNTNTNINPVSTIFHAPQPVQTVPALPVAVSMLHDVNPVSQPNILTNSPTPIVEVESGLIENNESESMFEEKQSENAASNSSNNSSDSGLNRSNGKERGRGKRNNGDNNHTHTRDTSIHVQDNASRTNNRSRNGRNRMKEVVVNSNQEDPSSNTVVESHTEMNDIFNGGRDGRKRNKDKADQDNVNQIDNMSASKRRKTRSSEKGMSLKKKSGTVGTVGTVGIGNMMELLSQIDNPSTNPNTNTNSNPKPTFTNTSPHKVDGMSMSSRRINRLYNATQNSLLMLPYSHYTKSSASLVPVDTHAVSPSSSVKKTAMKKDISVQKSKTLKNDNEKTNPKTKMKTPAKTKTRAQSTLNTTTTMEVEKNKQHKGEEKKEQQRQNTRSNPAVSTPTATPTVLCSKKTKIKAKETKEIDIEKGTTTAPTTPSGSVSVSTPLSVPLVTPTRISSRIKRKKAWEDTDDEGMNTNRYMKDKEKEKTTGSISKSTSNTTVNDISASKTNNTTSNLEENVEVAMNSRMNSDTKALITEQELLSIKVQSPIGTISHGANSNNNGSSNNGAITAVDGSICLTNHLSNNTNTHTNAPSSSSNSNSNLSPNRPLAYAAIIRENNMKRLLSPTIPNPAPNPDPNPDPNSNSIPGDTLASISNDRGSVSGTTGVMSQKTLEPSVTVKMDTQSVPVPVPKKMSTRRNQVTMQRMAKEIVFSKDKPDDLFAMTPGKGLHVPYFNKNEEVVMDTEGVVDGMHVVYRRQCDIEGIKTPNMNNLNTSIEDSNSNSNFESESDRDDSDSSSSGDNKSSSSRKGIHSKHVTSKGSERNHSKFSKKTISNTNATADAFKLVSYSHKLAEKLKQNKKQILKEKNKIEKKNKSTSEITIGNNMSTHHFNRKNMKYQESIQQKLKNELKKIENEVNNEVDNSNFEEDMESEED